jgi:hypothetical protein
MVILRFAASCVAACRLRFAESLPTGFLARFAEQMATYHFIDQDIVLFGGLCVGGLDGSCFML